MLSDIAIYDLLERGVITVAPIDDLDKRLQPASLDVRLGSQFLVPRRHRLEFIDPKADSSILWDPRTVPENQHFVLHPGEFVLATTIERVTLPDSVAARVEGKSSVGRLGILVHSTAGFIDPGFDGEVTLEIFSVSALPTRLYPGMPIAQLAFIPTDQPVANPYAGKYTGQVGPQPSRYHRNWNGNW